MVWIAGVDSSLFPLAETGFLIPTLTSILYALERVSYAIVDRNRG